MPDRILIVDDEPDILNLVKMILEGERYQVVVASNGEEALQKAETEMPDLILLDLVMPGKSGLEVCRILKSQAKTKIIPVIMFTALGRDVDMKLAIESGADGFFIKPCTSERLFAEVKQCLKKVRAWKFSKQLGLEHRSLSGKKILFEFEPSVPYERIVRDFAFECAFQGELTHVLTRRSSAVQQALDDLEGVELIELTPQLMISSILADHPDKPLSLVCDSLTDIILSEGPQSAYKFARNTLEIMSEPRITAVFLLNASAHEVKEVNSIRSLFKNQVSYGKQGMTIIRIDPADREIKKQDKTEPKVVTSPVKTQKCPNCGSENLPMATYCYHCNSSLRQGTKPGAFLQ
jgi:CheY-like chemotaxis protein